MDLKNMKVSIGIVVTIVAQAFGIIWYVAQLDSNINSLNTTVFALEEQATSVDIAVLNSDVDNLKEELLDLKRMIEILSEELKDKEFDSSHLERSIEHLEEEYIKLEDEVDALEARDLVIENEMRTIMSDHSSFGDILKDLGKSGYGDTRHYGDYK